MEHAVGEAVGETKGPQAPQPTSSCDKLGTESEPQGACRCAAASRRWCSWQWMSRQEQATPRAPLGWRANGTSASRTGQGSDLGWAWAWASESILEYSKETQLNAIEVRTNIRHVVCERNTR